MIRIMLPYERSRAWASRSAIYVDGSDAGRDICCIMSITSSLECRNSTTNRHVLRSLLYALYNNSQPTYPVWYVGTTRAKPLCLLVSLFCMPFCNMLFIACVGIGSFCIKIQGLFLCYLGTKAGNRRILLGSVPTRILVGTSPWSFQLLILASLLISRTIERTQFSGASIPPGTTPGRRWRSRSRLPLVGVWWSHTS